MNNNKMKNHVSRWPINYGMYNKAGQNNDIETINYALGAQTTESFQSEVPPI